MSSSVPSISVKWLASEWHLAMQLLNIGAIKFGSFEVVNPKLSPSPVYIDIRTKDNPKPGPIGKGELEMIARELFRVADEACIGFDFVCGVPNAGDPIADVMWDLYGSAHGFEKLRMKKKERPRRFYFAEKITNKRLRQGKDRVLLLDNAISAGDTNLKAIEAVESAGYRVSGVAILVDREQGGFDEIERQGYKIVC